MLYIHNYFTTNVTFTVSSTKYWDTVAGWAPNVYRCSTVNRDEVSGSYRHVQLLKSVENNSSNVLKFLLELFHQSKLLQFSLRCVYFCARCWYINRWPKNLLVWHRKKSVIRLRSAYLFIGGLCTRDSSKGKLSLKILSIIMYAYYFEFPCLIYLHVTLKHCYLYYLSSFYRFFGAWARSRC